MRANLLLGLVLLKNSRGETISDDYAIESDPTDCAQCSDTSTAEGLMECYQSLQGDCRLNITWTRTISFADDPDTKACLQPSGLGFTLLDNLIVKPVFTYALGLKVTLDKPYDCSEDPPFQAYPGSGPDESQCGHSVNMADGSPFPVLGDDPNTLSPQFTAHLFVDKTGYLGIVPASSCAFPARPLTVSTKLHAYLSRSDVFQLRDPPVDSTPSPEATEPGESTPPSGGVPPEETTQSSLETTQPSPDATQPSDESTQPSVDTPAPQSTSNNAPSVTTPETQPPGSNPGDGSPDTPSGANLRLAMPPGYTIGALAALAAFLD